MNKFFTKIAGLTLGLAMAIGVGVALGSKSSDVKRAEADNTTYTFTSKSWADSSNSWTSNSDGGQKNDQGVQVSKTYSGAGATTKSSFTNVTKVEFTYSTNASDGSGSISVQVGSNTAQTCSVTNSGGTSDRKTGHTYSTAQTGAVTFVVTCTKNSIYLKSVTITASGGGTAPTGAATSSSFSSTKEYFLRGENGTNYYYLSGVTSFDQDLSWGPDSSSTNNAHRFKIEGSTGQSSATVVVSTVINQTTYYLKQSSSNKKFLLSSSEASISIKSDGKISNTGDSSNLRYNYNNGSGGFRWYTDTTAQPAYLIEAPTVYTITYNANGGTGTMQNTVGTSVNAASCGYTRTGYTFSEWNTADDGTGTSYAAGAAVNKTVTLYAQWTINKYSVTYNKNTTDSVTGLPDQVTNINYNTDYTLSTDTVTRTGYDFDGWSTIQGDNNSSGKVTSIVVNENKTVYAIWNIKSYTVNGGSTTDYITNGSISSAANVNHGSALNITISASSGYKLPSTLTSVTMGDDTLSAGTGYTYNSSTGAFSIASVTGNVVITATCPAQTTPVNVNINVSDGTHNGPSTMYKDDVISFKIVADEHYKLPASITITGALDSEYIPSTGDVTISGASGDVTVTAVCVEKAKYDVNLSLTNVNKTSGPSGEDVVEEGEIVELEFASASGYALPASITIEMGGNVLVDGADYSWTKTTPTTGTLELLELTADLSVTITGEKKALSSLELTLNSNSGDYALGDKFTMPIVTASFNTGSEIVTAQATATGGGLENGIFTSTGDSKVVTISYSYGNQTATATYTAKVTEVVPIDAYYEKVTKTSDVTTGQYLIVYETESKALDGSAKSSDLGAKDTYKSVEISESTIAASATVDAFSVTITSVSGGFTIQTASGHYIGRTASSNGIDVSDETAYKNTISISSNNAVITGLTNEGAATSAKLQYLNQTNGNTFKYYASNQKPVQLYKYVPGVERQFKWVTAVLKDNTKTYYQSDTVTASDFVVTAHYDNGDTSVLNDSDVTISNGILSIIGKNTVTISYSGESCYVDVTAIERTATYTGLTWDQGELTILDGNEIDFSELGTVTAQYDSGASTSTKAIASCTVSVYTKTNDTYTKVTDLEDGDEITSAYHGKYLGVTYTETNTFTAYSSAPIYVVEKLNEVYHKAETISWSKVTSLKVGDIVTFVNEDNTKVASGHSSNIINTTTYSSSVSTTFYFEVGKVGDYYTFHNANGYLGNHSTGTKDNNYAYLDAEIDLETNMNYFTVDFDDDGNIIITSVYDSNRKLQYNSNRFCFYGSNQSVVQLYKGIKSYKPEGENIANSNVLVQKAVLEFVASFNETMACVNAGSTLNVSSKWSTLSSAFTTAMSAFTGDDLAHFKALFAGANAVEGGDSLQDMLARYEYICRKYGLDDFLADIERPPVSQTIVNNPFAINMKNASATIIVVVISAISAAAIGGYFLFRKKKED